MTLRSPIAAIAVLALATVVAEQAHAQDVILSPEVTGSIRSIRDLNLLEPAPTGGEIQSTWFQSLVLEYRRGFAEFQIPAFATSVQRARLVLTETRGTTSFPLPPDTHELSFYEGDLVVSVEDYDRPTTPIATFQTDNNEPAAVFSFDIAAVLRRFQGRNLGFRVKLACDPYCVGGNVGSGFGGSSFGGPSTIPPRIEVTFGEVLTVPFDVKPSSCPNVLNLGSRGVLPSAILGTDAVNVADIDAASIRLLGVAPLRIAVEDVGAPGSAEPCAGSGPDGVMDLILNFDTQQLVAAIASVLGHVPADGEVVTLSLSGQLKDGTPIIGEDTIIALGAPR